jgi:putative FmdB family regulatory protein
MPTYEYACKSCDEHVEVVQSFKDEPLTECPNCGGPLRKVFGSIGISFKGSGFYKTDSRKSESVTTSASSGSSESSGSSDKAASSSDKASTSAEKATPAPSSSSDSGKKAAAS